MPESGRFTSAPLADCVRTPLVAYTKAAIEDPDAQRPVANSPLVGRTAMELYESTSHTWLATQADVPVTGRSSTAAEATADYCRRVDALDE